MLLRVGADGSRTEGRRVAITGLGVVACCGIGTKAFWDGLQGPAPVAEHRVHDFDATMWFAPAEVDRVDRFAQLSVAAAEMALDDAGDVCADPQRAGVIFATGIGALERFQDQIRVFLEKGAGHVVPYLMPMSLPNMGAAHVSMRTGWRGPCETITTACASGTHAIAAAARLVASGRCDVAIGGGADTSMARISVEAFEKMRALSEDGVSRPFDARRDGFILAEGSGAVVVEELGRARERGAPVYAELLGAGSTADAYHITGPAPGGAYAARCMQLAMHDAGVRAEEIGHINAHGTSTTLNDLAEAQAIAEVFGVPGPPVTSIKGVTGHALGGAGAIEAVASALTITRGLIPPTVGYQVVDPEIPLDVVHPRARPWEPAPMLSNSFGFGGHNCCLVISPVSSPVSS